LKSLIIAESQSPYKERSEKIVFNFCSFGKEEKGVGREKICRGLTFGRGRLGGKKEGGPSHGWRKREVTGEIGFQKKRNLALRKTILQGQS